MSVPSGTTTLRHGIVVSHFGSATILLMRPEADGGP